MKRFLLVLLILLIFSSYVYSSGQSSSTVELTESVDSSVSGEDDFMGGDPESVFISDVVTESGTLDLSGNSQEKIVADQAVEGVKVKVGEDGIEVSVDLVEGDTLRKDASGKTVIDGSPTLGNVGHTDVEGATVLLI